MSHMFERGVPRLWTKLKLCIFMFVLLSLDAITLSAYMDVASKKSTFYTWVVFEAVTMMAMVMVSFGKYLIHVIDLRLDNGWPGKSAYLFYVELVGDMVNMTIFLTFMLTFFIQNPTRLPMYMISDVIQVARNLTQRLKSFRKYRRITHNMDQRFPSASDEEIEEADSCIICRDQLWEGSKKLPCGHIFHLDCLKSWLVMQQVCPTCRAEIPADAPLAEIPVPAPGLHVEPPAHVPVVAPHEEHFVARADAAARPPPTLPGSQDASSTQPVISKPELGLPQANSLFTQVPACSHDPRAGPEVGQILESMEYAHSMAVFMREQVDFWMAQVQAIQGQDSSVPRMDLPVPPPFLNVGNQHVRRPGHTTGFCKPVSSSGDPVVDVEDLKATNNESEVTPEQNDVISELEELRRRRSEKYRQSLNEEKS